LGFIVLFSNILVLIDPHKRAIYDALGTEGLLQNALQLVVRSKTPQEIREEYERLSKQKEEILREKMTNTHVNSLDLIRD
jgi:DnaJ family protein C protein 11